MGFLDNLFKSIGPTGDRRLVTKLSNLESLYRRSQVISATRTTDLLKALDIGHNEPVLLWCLRWPLDPKSKEADVFRKRLTKILRQRARIPNVRHYGVDLTGVAFVTADYFPFQDILTERLDAQEIGAIFFECAKQTAALHRAGIVLGDICGQSFTFNQDGRITISHLLGSIPGTGRGSTKQPLEEEHGYLSPEQRSGKAPTCASDVYSLGVFLAHLSTRHGFIQASSQEKHEDYLQKNIPDLLGAYTETPSWAQEILNGCLHWDPSERYPSAVELFAGLNQVVSYHDKFVYRNKAVSKAVRASRAQKTQALWERIKNLDFSQTNVGINTQFLIGAICVTCIFLFIAASYRFHEQPQPIVTGGLGSAIDELKDKNKSEEKVLKRKWSEIKQIINTPQSNQDVSGFFDFKNKDYWQSSNSSDNPETSLWQELSRASGQSAGKQSNKAAAESNPLAQAKNKAELGVNAQTQQPSSLAAAVSNNTVTAGTGTKQTSPEPDSASEDETEATAESLASGDIRRILLRMPASGDFATLHNAAKDALRRNLYPPLQQVFLAILVQKANLSAPPDVQHTLARAGVGSITQSTVHELGQWSSPYAEHALLAACAGTKQRHIAGIALTYLAARPLRNPRAQELISQIKSRYWLYHERLARPVCTVALLELATPETLFEAFNTLLPYSGGILLASEEEIEKSLRSIQTPWCPVPES